MYEISCESYNQNIAVGGSVSFEFLVEPGSSDAEMTEILVSEFISGGQSDSEDDISEPSDEMLFIYTILGVDTDELELYMLPSVDCYSYEIYSAVDGNEYKLVDTISEDSYMYLLDYLFEKTKIYVRGYYNEGEYVDSKEIVVEFIDGEYVIILSDTDGDGLDDSYELLFTATDPFLIDTDENGVLDSDGDGISDYDELGGIPNQEVVYFNGDLYTCTFNHMKSHPGKADTDGDGIPDAVDENVNVKDMIEIASLDNEKFVPIELNNGRYYGGYQGWWENEITAIDKYGCGTIAMCNLELYLALNHSDLGLNYSEEIDVNSNGNCTYEFYKNYVTDRYNGVYHFPLYLLDFSFGLAPWAMEEGIEEFYNYNGQDVDVVWGLPYTGNDMEFQIIDMLQADIPVVASHHVYLNENKLVYYILDEDNYTMKKSGGCMSHYFNITGLVEKYENDRYIKYICISTSGQKKYAKFDNWNDNLSYFGNILYISY